MTIALEGIVALVTGANGGIGREVVKAMKAAGATVIASDLADTDESGADHYFRHDVSKPEDWQQIAAFVKTEFGHLDALVNNAGISTVASFEETPLSEFHRINSVNLDSIVIGTQALMEMLKAGGKRRESGAAVVNFSSVGGQRGAPFNAAYCTSKAAVAMLSKCTGAEFAALGYNIRVNSVHPGGIDTGMMRSIAARYVELGAAPDVDTALANVATRHPIGRMGRPDELAGGARERPGPSAERREGQSCYPPGSIDLARIHGIGTAHREGIAPVRHAMRDHVGAQLRGLRIAGLDEEVGQVVLQGGHAREHAVDHRAYRRATFGNGRAKS